MTGTSLRLAFTRSPHDVTLPLPSCRLAVFFSTPRLLDSSTQPAILHISVAPSLRLHNWLLLLVTDGGSPRRNRAEGAPWCRTITGTGIATEIAMANGGC